MPTLDFRPLFLKIGITPVCNMYNCTLSTWYIEFEQCSISICFSNKFFFLLWGFIWSSVYYIYITQQNKQLRILKYLGSGFRIRTLQGCQIQCCSSIPQQFPTSNNTKFQENSKQVKFKTINEHRTPSKAFFLEALGFSDFGFL